MVYTPNNSNLIIPIVYDVYILFVIFKNFKKSPPGFIKLIVVFILGSSLINFIWSIIHHFFSSSDISKITIDTIRENILISSIIELVFIVIIHIAVNLRSASIVVKIASEGYKEDPGLSPRENEVLKLVSSGYTNNEIAEYMNISISTVKTHVFRIYKKKSVCNRVQLINKYN